MEETVLEQKKKRAQKLAKGGIVWSIFNLVEAALLVVLGILAMIYSTNDGFQDTIILIVGIFLALGGLLRVAMNFLPLFGMSELDKANLKYDLVIEGSLEMAIGITIIVMYATNSSSFTVLTSLLSYFIGIVFIVAGTSLLLFAIGFLVNKLYKVYMPVLEIILAAALIALGVVVLVYMGNKGNFMMVFLIIVGIVLVLAGIGVLITTIRVISVANRAHKVAKAMDKVVGEVAKPQETVEVHVQDETKEEPKNVNKDQPKDGGK